jgi:hypothetical protein
MTITHAGVIRLLAVGVFQSRDNMNTTPHSSPFLIMEQNQMGAYVHFARRGPDVCSESPFPPAFHGKQKRQ